MEAIKAQSRPNAKDLHNFVIPYVGNKWYELGIQLLDANQESMLQSIGANHGHDVKKCCSETFNYWLQTHPDGNWDQLVKALRKPAVELNYLAQNIEKEFTVAASVDNLQQLVTKDENDIDFDFSIYEDVSLAFSALTSKLQTKIKEIHFPIVRSRCASRARPGPMKTAIKATHDINSLFDLLSDNTTYCNWMNIKFLETIATAVAAASGNNGLERLIQNYKNAIYHRTLRQVWDNIPAYHEVRSKYYSKLKAVFGDKDPDTVTVKEVLTQCEPDLVKNLALDILVITEGSLQIFWLISTNDVYQAFLSLLSVPQEQRNDDFLQVGAWVVYHPQSVLVELRKIYAMISTYTLLIGYYHGLLMRDINVDQLNVKMFTSGLLTAHDQNIYLTSHSIHHKKYLLLEIVRHMDGGDILKFCQALGEVCPQISSQLNKAMQSVTSSVFPIVSESDDDHTKCCPYISTTSVHIVFLHLVDQITELLQQHDHQQLLMRCREIKASEIHGICLYSDTQLSGCESTSLLLRELCYYTTWSDHSILRVLSRCSTIATKLLDEFDSRFDCSEPIASYPIPYLSSDMIPTDPTSTHTVLAIKCDQELYNRTLQYVYDMRSLIVEKCDITLHCLQLLAVRPNPTIIYWTIPKCVVELISSKVPLHSDYLYSRGVLEVLMYPEPLLATSIDVRIGSLAFVAECEDNTNKVVSFDQNEGETAKLLESKVKSMEIEEYKLKVNQLESELDMMMKVKVQKLEKENKQLVTKQIEFKNDGKQLEVKIQKLEKENKWLVKKLTEFKTDKQFNTIQKLDNESGQLSKMVTEIKSDEQLSTIHRLEKENEQLSKKVTEFNTDVKQLEKFRHLGTGRYGETHVATFEKRNCAVKTLYKKFLNQGLPITKVITEFKNNCAICFEFRNSNLVTFIDISEAENLPVFITELMEMNLFTYIKDKGSEVLLDIHQQLLLCTGMSHGLEVLHGNSLIHGNLHDHNVLIQGNQAKISDFYYPLLKLNKDFYYDTSSMKRTLPFSAPEIIENGTSPSFSSDIFSFGALALQVVTGTAPMEHNFKKILADISSNHVLLQLIKQCLSKDSQTRPSIAKVCKGVERFQESSVEKRRKLLKKSNANKRILVRFVKILLTGSGAAGKTSFSNLLMKKPFNTDHRSTNVIHSKHAISIKKAIMVESKHTHSQDIVWLEMDSNVQITLLRQALLLSNLPEQHPRNIPQQAKHSEPKVIDDRPLKLTSEKKHEIQRGTQLSIKQQIAGLFQSSVKWEKLASFNALVENPSSGISTHASNVTALTLHPGEVLNIITILDTGGQPEYVHLLPTVNIHPMITFIVHDLSKHLDDQVLVEYSEHGKHTFEPYHLQYSYIDKIKFLMSSVNDSLERPLPQVPQLVTVPGKNTTSYLCFVGTHADKVGLDIVRNTDSRLRNMIGKLDCKAAVWLNEDDRVLFPVDNTTAGREDTEDPVATLIRNKINLFSLNKDIYEVPITWMLLELEICQICNRRRQAYISFQECVSIALQSRLITDVEQVRSALLYHHLLGVLLYYPEVPGLCDYIIIDHQWLFDRLNQIVCYTFKQSFTNLQAATKLKCSGILSKKLLRELEWEDELKEDYFLSLLMTMNIIAPVPREDGDGDDYFIPYLLPTYTIQPMSDYVLSQYGCLQGEPLLIQYVSNLLPRGFFCCLIVEILQHLPSGWSHLINQNHQVVHAYSNLITFCLPHAYYLSLLDSLSFLEVQIRHAEELYHKKCPVHLSVQNVLARAIENVCEQLKFNQGRLQYGFHCQCGYSVVEHIATLTTLSPPFDYAHCSHGSFAGTTLQPSHTVWLIEQCQEERI
ncbi:uncharacterized protein [Dysidea avara]|uniref:uncharacterized protein isoform X2 n=1 Tax=Dysidea avara TaxID=196820 RepID=UPI0033178482